jgi:DedD protein
MDFVLKQRLVGAVVLVALGVIFIPMLLEGPDDTLVPELDQLPELVDPAPSRPLEAFPTMDTLPVSPDTSVLAADAAPDAEPVPEPEPLAEPEPEPEAQAEAQAEVQGGPVAAESGVQPAPVAEPAAQEQQPAHAADAEPEAGPLGSWVVQVGSFSSQQNAIGLRDKLRDGDFTTQVEKVRVAGKTHYRVRVGPFLERGEAEQKRKQLADKFKLSGRVLSYP